MLNNELKRVNASNRQDSKESSLDHFTSPEDNSLLKADLSDMFNTDGGCTGYLHYIKFRLRGTELLSSVTFYCTKTCGFFFFVVVVVVVFCFFVFFVCFFFSFFFVLFFCLFFFFCCCYIIKAPDGM